MTKRNARTIAMWCVGVGVVVVVVMGMVLKDRIREEYYLYRLEHGDKEAKKVAAERLGEIGSVRAVPVILRLFQSLSEEELAGFLPLVDHGSITNQKSLVPILSDVPTLLYFFSAQGRSEDLVLLRTLADIANRCGEACVPYLTKSLDSGICVAWPLRCSGQLGLKPEKPSQR
jgi:hypothetical protein